MTNPRLPPLKSLQVFASAARHLSFTKAADELFVTQAAVSHQIKALESHLGLNLFARHNRTLSLTEAGQRYLPEVERAFDLLKKATDDLTVDKNAKYLTVTMLPSIATRWLVPRIGKFMRAYPDINVRIHPSQELSDFRRDNVDAGLRYGAGKYPGLETVYLMQEDVFPVCSPALLNDNRPLNKPEDLKHHTLLHDDNSVALWKTWLDAVGATGVDATRGPVLTDSSMLIQAAVDGNGVALARSALAMDDLNAGRLIKPFDFSIPQSYAYYFVYLTERKDDEEIVAFKEWLLAEVAQDEQALARESIR